MAPRDDTLNTETRPTFVGGVANSAKGRRWVYTDGDHRAATALAQQHDLPEIVARVLAARGVAASQVPDFLDPTLRSLLPDPSGLLDMDRLAARLALAIQEGQRIAVFGDYDVDGATATAIMVRFLRALGADPLIHIPDRMSEGYGPSVEAFERLIAQGAQVIITVDCGVAAHDPIAVAQAAGTDVLVLDHHEAGSELPIAHALVNPKRLDQPKGFEMLAACAVTFLATVATNRTLRVSGFFGDQVQEPDLRQWLDLVALGTVCDVMPLSQPLNRAFVRQGLKVMAGRSNAGLAALADAANVGQAPTAYHLGFVLGPRINAAGRVGESGYGARLLTCETLQEAEEAAAVLDIYNRDRRDIEAAALDQALAMIEADTALADGPAVIVAGQGWHPGVVGIVASRLKDQFEKPCCVLGIDDQGIARGSGRSVSGVDLGAAVIAAREADLLLSGGGHAMAAGFSLQADGVDDFRSFINRHIAAAGPPVEPDLSLPIDGVISAGGADLSLAQALERLEPFGAGHEEPRLAILNARIHEAAPVGKNHLRVRITDLAGGWCGGIAFRCLETPLGQLLLDGKDRNLHLAGRLQVNRWQGRERVQFQIDDAAPAD